MQGLMDMDPHKPKMIAGRIVAAAYSEPVEYSVGDPDVGCEVVRTMLLSDVIFRSSSPGGGVLKIVVQFPGPAEREAIESILDVGAKKPTSPAGPREVA